MLHTHIESAGRLQTSQSAPLPRSRRGWKSAPPRGETTVATVVPGIGVPGARSPTALGILPSRFNRAISSPGLGLITLVATILSPDPSGCACGWRVWRAAACGGYAGVEIGVVSPLLLWFSSPGEEEGPLLPPLEGFPEVNMSAGGMAKRHYVFCSTRRVATATAQT